MLQKLRQSAFKQKQYDFLAKIVIIGNSAVGKTNMLLRFVQQKYNITHTPTIGVDFKFKILSVPSLKNNQKKKVKLQVWDTAGQERFRNMTETYFKGVSGIIIVYAINDRKSFQDVKSWIRQLQQHGIQNMPKIIIGNKCDLQDERKVSCEQGRLVAVQNNCVFMQVSAKQNINITEMFDQLSMSVVQNIQIELFPSISSSNLREERLPHIVVNESLRKKKDCC